MEKICVITTDCGKITLTCSQFGGLILFGQKFEGSFLIQLDSLKIEFPSNFIRIRDISFSLDNEERKNSGSFQVTNNSVRIHFTVSSEIPVNLDTVTMLVLPCNYIMCSNKPLITDTIRINLK
jgi:hypothetical protein